VNWGVPCPLPVPLEELETRGDMFNSGYGIQVILVKECNGKKTSEGYRNLGKMLITCYTAQSQLIRDPGLVVELKLN
jgi:hypothetical protein